MAVVASVGVGFVLGHAALAVLMPLAVLPLVAGHRRHRQPFALGVGVLAGGIAYVHILAGTPEWTLSFVVALSGLAAILDWRAVGSLPSRRSAEQFYAQVRCL